MLDSASHPLSTLESIHVPQGSERKGERKVAHQVPSGLGDLLRGSPSQRTLSSYRPVSPLVTGILGGQGSNPEPELGSLLLGPSHTVLSREPAEVAREVSVVPGTKGHRGAKPSRERVIESSRCGGNSQCWGHFWCVGTAVPLIHPPIS